jgi:WD40 repeat protein/tRNA A-37 threonylcarbamoyl transferase component Bud32
MGQDRSSRRDGTLDAERLRPFVNRFEDAWQGGQPPDLTSFLPKEPGLRSLVLRELALIDLECRLKSGAPVRAEEYLKRFPELAADRRFVLKLLSYEFDLRRRGEPDLKIDEYLRRFPAYRAELTARLARKPAKKGSDSPTASATGSSSPDFQRTRTFAASHTRSPPRLRTAPVDKLPSVPGYQIEAILGRGGMGVVYKARHQQLKRPVALKMILAGGQAADEELARFRTEAEAVAHLQHPNIVQIYEVGEQDGLPYFSLEFCAGGSLKDKLDGTPLPPPEAASLMETLARAMHHAHQQGIIHRDLKPANILLTGRSDEGRDDGASFGGIPKITDFGLAKKLDTAGQTQTGAIMGTPSYMAPEQACGDSKAIGPAGDVYALGAVLYELLTGRPPFKAATAMETIRQVMTHEAVPPGRLQSNVPRDLETICLKCLRKEPARRYDSAFELAEDLRRFQRGEAIKARAVGSLERAVKWVRRHQGVSAGLAAAVLALVLGTVLALWQAGVAGVAEEKEASQRQRAEGLATKEAAARKGKEEQSRRSELTSYAARLAAAQGQWQDGNGPRALELLESCPASLRGLEHRLLWTLFNSNQRTLLGHTKGVTTVAYSSDGTRLVSGSADGTAKVWDAQTGQERFMVEHSGPGSVAFSPDGSRLVSIGMDRTAKVWDADNGKELYSIEGTFSGPLVFTPGGKYIVSGRDGMLKVWDAATGKVTRSLSGALAPVAFSSDGKRFLCGSNDNTKVWDVQTGQVIHTLRRHKRGDTCAAYSPDGTRIVTGGPAFIGEPVVLKVWDANTGQGVFTLTGHTEQINSVAFSSDSKRIVSGAFDCSVRVWDAETGREIATLKGHRQGVFSVAFSPDGKHVVSGSGDNTVKLWDAGKRQEFHTIKARQQYLSSVALSPDGRRIVSGGFDCTLKVWDADDGREIFTLKGHRHPVTSVALSHDGKRLVSGAGTRNQRGELKVWDTETGQQLHTLEGHKGPVSSVAFSPDGKHIVSADRDLNGPGELKVWDATTGQALRTLRGHKNGIASLAFSADGKRLVSGGGTSGQAGELKVWDIETGQEVQTLQGHTRPVSSVAFSRDGKYIVSGDRSLNQPGELKVWDTDTGLEVHTLKGHTNGVSSVAFSPDGKRIVSGSADGTLKVWEADLGQEVLTLAGHAAGVNGIAFSSDGSRLVSCSDDTTLKVWCEPPGYW